MKVNYTTEEEELKQLKLLVDKFAEDMFKKLKKKYHEGYRNWEKISEVSPMYTSLHNKLDSAVFGLSSDQLIDIANLSALIWNHTEE